MGVIDDTLSNNKCQPFGCVSVSACECAFACGAVAVYIYVAGAMDWKCGNSIPIVSWTTSNKLKHAHTHIIRTHFAFNTLQFESINWHFCVFIDSNQAMWLDIYDLTCGSCDWYYIYFIINYLFHSAFGHTHRCVFGIPSRGSKCSLEYVIRWPTNMWLLPMCHTQSHTHSNCISKLF